jgi:hypothetical protein
MEKNWNWSFDPINPNNPNNNYFNGQNAQQPMQIQNYGAQPEGNGAFGQPQTLQNFPAQIVNHNANSQPGLLPEGRSLWDRFAGYEDKSGKHQGFGMPAFQAAGGAMQGYLGMRQLQATEDTMAQNKLAFNLNYDASRQTTNNAMQDDYAFRQQQNPNDSRYAQSVDEYMAQRGIKGRV